MASDIADNGTFVVASMKPSPGEQADAIHQQKMAQNSGFIFGRPIGWTNTGIGTNGTNTVQAVNNFSNAIGYKVFFFRSAGHNKISGTYTAAGTFDSTGGPDTYYSDGFSVGGDSGTYTNYQSGTNANIGAHQKWGSTYRFTVDLASYVPENTWGTLTGTFWGTSADGGVSSRNIHYEFPAPIIAQTYWDA